MTDQVKEERVPLGKVELEAAANSLAEEHVILAALVLAQASVQLLLVDRHAKFTARVHELIRGVPLVHAVKVLVRVEVEVLLLNEARDVEEALEPRQLDPWHLDERLAVQYEYIPQLELLQPPDQVQVVDAVANELVPVELGVHLSAR